eukprot:Tamp_02073.p1 GENE.Tamp_02073~~Tamp_02073.p1  ORF type:complete len:594 (-),score=151.12 Tamp_02073:2584-4365(-)
MARALRVLAALSLLLPAHCAALQSSFQASIAGLLQVGANPFGATPSAGAQTRLLAKHAHAKLLAKPSLLTTAKPAPIVALQLGTDHPELTAINEHLDSILAQLALQDQQDTTLLNAKTTNHTAAVAQTRQANASLADKVATHDSAATVCTNKRNSAINDEEPHRVAAMDCDNELKHLQAMEQALSDLTSVGQSPLAAGGFLQKNSFLELASKIKSVPADDKATLVNLLGTDYGQDTRSVEVAIANLKTKILAKKKAAEDAIAAIKTSQQEACDAADAAASEVVVYELRQAAALTLEQATGDDLMTTTSMVAASRQETTALRTTIAEIKAKLQDLANVPSTSALQKLPSSMLQMHMAQFSDAVEAIKTMLRAIDTRIETERATEIGAKTAKHGAWNAAKEAYESFVEDAAVQSSTLSTLSTRLAELTGTKDQAKSALDDEKLSQVREKAMFEELRVLLGGLASQGSEANALATSQTKEMIALAVGAERSHADLIQRFETLLHTLETEMLEKKTAMQMAYDAHAANHATLTASHADQQTKSNDADAAKQEAKTSMETALLEYDTAAETLDANNELRASEQDLVRTLLAMVDQLKA